MSYREILDVDVTSFEDHFQRLVQAGLFEGEQIVCVSLPSSTEQNKEQRTYKFDAPEQEDVVVDDETYVDDNAEYIDPFAGEDESEEDERLFANEFEVPPELESELDQKSDDLALDLREKILQKSLATNMAVDKASAQAEAIMREFYGVEVKIDNGVLALLNAVTELEFLEKFLNESELSMETRSAFLAHFVERNTEVLVNRVAKKKDNKETSRRFRAELENATAKVRNSLGKLIQRNP